MSVATHRDSVRFVPGPPRVPCARKSFFLSFRGPCGRDACRRPRVRRHVDVEEEVRSDPPLRRSPASGLSWKSPRKRPTEGVVMSALRYVEEDKRLLTVSCTSVHRGPGGTWSCKGERFYGRKGVF